ncbi:hypothetical protein K435DRAFT_678289, partial [Dendrothele bispora CBS 962.96]
FYEWFQNVINYACKVRWNQRPPVPNCQYRHDGHMAQFGLSNGPRHLHAANVTSIGWGKSYQKKLTTEECIVHDEDVNAAAGIFWSLIESSLPLEVTTPVIELQKLNIPRLASRYVNPGSGFKLTIDEMEYNFFNFEQAPPEVDLTQGYSVSVFFIIMYGFLETDKRPGGPTLISVIPPGHLTSLWEGLKLIL